MKNEVDPGFINDNYTLLFPLKTYWDTSPAAIDAGMCKLPVGSCTGELMALKYPAEGGGYTPGDTWELYVAKDGRVEYFVYHPAGPRSPAFSSQLGETRKRRVLCSSQLTTADSRMASRSRFGFLMWQSR